MARSSVTSVATKRKGSGTGTPAGRGEDPRAPALPVLESSFAIGRTAAKQQSRGDVRASSGFFYVSAEAVTLVRARSRRLPLPHQPFLTQNLGSACALIGPERTNAVSHLLLTLGFVAFPAREVGGKAAAVRIIGNLDGSLLYLGATREPETDIVSDR
jgi:hypothetical protein